MSAHVYGEMVFNLMFHGKLFEGVVKDPTRQGCSKWPLIGLFDSSGMFDAPSDDVAFAGQNALTCADQHIHKVDFHGNTWHFGSDMAKFCVDPEKPFAHAWCVAVDLDEMCCDILCLVMVNPEMEGRIDKVLRQASTGNDGDGTIDTAILWSSFSKTFASELNSCDSSLQDSIRFALTGEKLTHE
jgi:hypothetical protein